MTTRAVPYLLAVAVVGLLAGSGLAGLANAPGNDPCLASEYAREGTSFGSSLELWPLGLRCDYLVGTAAARSEFLGPTMAALYAWIAVAALLTLLALLRRDSALVRGAAGAANLLAVSGLAWQGAGAQFALFIPLVLGVPLAFPLDHLLRPAGRRSLARRCSWPSQLRPWCSARSSPCSPSRSSGSPLAWSPARSRARPSNASDPPTPSRHRKPPQLRGFSLADR